jgi:hypothetical protein
MQSSGKAQTLAPSTSNPQTKQCVHINTHICQLLHLPVCGGVKFVNTPASRMNAGPSARATQHQIQKRGGRKEYKSSARSSPVVIAPGSRNGGIAKQECERCTTLKQNAALLLFERDSVATAAAPCTRGQAAAKQRCKLVLRGGRVQAAVGLWRRLQVTRPCLLHADFVYRLSVVNRELQK